MLAADNPLVREYFGRIIGEDGLRILETIPEEEITDEEIAKLSETKLTSVRKILYMLYESRIAEYRTERDDNTGWITYWWRFNHQNIKRMMEEEADGELARLEKSLNYEQNGEFYRCQCQRVFCEEAAEKEFWCEECEANFEYFDNSEIVTGIEQQINELKKWKRRVKRN
jgi:transcription initiation factor TFIIE subunit alpha